MLRKVIDMKIQAAKFENSNLQVSCFKTSKDNKAILKTVGFKTWRVKR